MSELFEQEVHLRDYLRVVKKRLWTMAVFFFFVVTLAYFNVSRQTPLYQAQARIQIDRENPRVLNFQEVVQPESGYWGDEYYKTQFQLLQSRSLALEVVNRLGLASNPEFVGAPEKKAPFPDWFGRLKALVARSSSGFGGTAPGGTKGFTEDPGPPADRATTVLIDRFLSRIEIKPLKETRLVDVAAVSGDARLAAGMANALATSFIEWNQRQRLTTTREATDWLSTQLEDARVKVQASEFELQRYKEQSDIVSPQDRQNLAVRKMEELSTTLTRAKTDRIALETRFRQMEKMIARQQIPDSIPEVMTNPIIQGLKREYGELQAQLSQFSKTYTAKHPKMIGLKSQLDSTSARLMDEVNKITLSIRNEYEVAKAREESLQIAVDQQKMDVQNLGQKSIRFSVLEREVENNRRIYDLLLNRAKETGLAEGLQTGNMRIVDRAEVPLAPFAPRKFRTMFWAVLVGLLGGLGLAFFFEYLDDTIKDPNDLENYVKLPFLAPIPIIKPKVSRTSRELIAEKEPMSPFSEAYRSARTSILFSSPDTQPATIMVTSAGPEEGKTTTATNLAITMAHAGNRTLLIDADLRKPRIHQVFGIKHTLGLSNLLADSTDIAASLHKTEIANLMVMTSGPIPPNPSELLGSQRMKKLLIALRENFEKVIIDCPPIISVADASILATQVDGVVIVVKAGRTSRVILRRAKKKLEDVRGRIFGVILNAVDVRKSSYYYSPVYYYSYYGEKKRKSGKRGKGLAAG